MHAPAASRAHAERWGRARLAPAGGQARPYGGAPGPWGRGEIKGEEGGK